MSNIDDVDFKDISTKVEAVKIAMRHTKDGHVVSFAINPHDTPHELMADPLGQRYLVVLVRLNQQDEPVASPENEEGKRAVMIAGAMCGDQNFQEWLCTTGEIDDLDESNASVWLRKRLGIVSRKELKTDKEARAKLMDVRAEFTNWMRSK